MRVKKSTPFVFVSVPADCEIPVENGMPKIYKKIALGDNDVVQRSFTLERTGKRSGSPCWRWPTCRSAATTRS